MKTSTRREEKSGFRWQHGIHLIFLLTIACLCIIIPVTNSLTGTPPYWAIAILFIIPSLFYFIFLIITIYSSNRKRKEEQTSHVELEDDTIRLQTDTAPSSIVSSSYNLSTVGIPPSSFLAPLPTTQVSIRSSSLDYTPPPPAYHDNVIVYPPSYHSNKEDTISVLY